MPPLNIEIGKLMAQVDILQNQLATIQKEITQTKEKDNLSLVKIDLITGRYHQIRVQFASRNHSLYGDQKYGTRGKGKQLALWAYSLSIIHPITKERMDFLYI